MRQKREYALFKGRRILYNKRTTKTKGTKTVRYKGKVYRPPSEAYSLIVQVTYGCSHNRCAFCDMYDDKHFAMRPMEEIREDFETARRLYRRVERVFLADGDALMRRTGDLVEILGLVYGLFPECERVTCYASPTSIQIKSEEELRLLREKGLVLHRPYVGRYACSMEMQGMSLSLMKLDDELKRLLDAPADSPFFKQF